VILTVTESFWQKNILYDLNVSVASFDIRLDDAGLQLNGHYSNGTGKRMVGMSNSFLKGHMFLMSSAILFHLGCYMLISGICGHCCCCCCIF
jgi:hypothetical protein